MSTASKLEQEREAQKRWRARKPERSDALVEQFLLSEYKDPEQAHRDEAKRLLSILSFARGQVPYYRENERWRAAKLKAAASCRDLLVQLPVLGKLEVQESFSALKAEWTPKAYAGRVTTSSSGTTGRRTQVLFSRPAFSFSGLFKQRQLRWARVDPYWTQAIIRSNKDIPLQADGKRLADGATHRFRSWMYLDKWFDTGPMIAFNRSNSLEAQIEWLQRERPEYLVSFPHNLDVLVAACQGKPVDSLQAFRGISTTLTQGMKTRIESATGIHVDQGYGLNEIGVVAGRCEAGRYHVHSEHCVVEIADDAGQPCKAGETGHLLVTGLRNMAMPLVRYDSGDLAVAVEGACSCGRTLPSFGRVIGRYRAMHYAPKGTAQRANLVSDTIDGLSIQTLKDLREYQLHQNRDGSFDLRLVTRGKPNPQLLASVWQAWDELCDNSTPLNILPVDHIPPAPGGKQQEFSSDFFPPVDEGSGADEAGTTSGQA